MFLFHVECCFYCGCPYLKLLLLVFMCRHGFFAANVITIVSVFKCSSYFFLLVLFSLCCLFLRFIAFYQFRSYFVNSCLCFLLLYFPSLDANFEIRNIMTEKTEK